MNPEGVSLLTGPAFASIVPLDVLAPVAQLLTGPVVSVSRGALLDDFVIADFIGGAGGPQAPPLPTTGIIYPRPRNVFGG